VTRVLVTGASGLLGVNVALEALTRYEVVGAVNGTPLHAPGFDTLQIDLLEPDAPARLLDESRADWVIHCAALADLDACERQPELAHKLNAELPGRLAAEAAKRKLRFLYVSTDAVFDGVKGDYVETDAPNPLSVYGRTKRMAELGVKAAHPHALIVRPNLFGWSVSGNRSLAEFFYNNLAAGKKVRGYTDRLFCPLLANDLAEIFFGLLEKDLKGIFHAVATNHISKYDFGVAIAHRFDFDAALIEPACAADANDPAPRAGNLTLKNGKLAAALGTRLPTVAAGIEKLFQLEQVGYRAKLHAMTAVAEPVKG
jgi:dTDP-4-dehydrorhamnose reductase